MQVSEDYAKNIMTGSAGGKYFLELDKQTKDLLDMTYTVAVGTIGSSYKNKYDTLLTDVTNKVPLFNGDKNKINAFAAKDSKSEIPELWKIGALGKLYNADTMTSDMIQKIASQGTRIDKWVRFGKSRGLYKSIKLPKYLMGYARIKQDPKPSQKLMGFTSFLWNLLGTGVLRPPSNFIRVANSYYRTLAKKTNRSPMTTADLANVVKSLDSTNPGLFNAYIEYSGASKEYRAKMKAISVVNQAEREKIMQTATAEYYTPAQAFAGFASALDAIQTVIPNKTAVTEDQFKKLGQMVDPKPKALPYKKVGFMSVGTSASGANTIGFTKVGSKDTLASVKAKVTQANLNPGKIGYTSSGTGIVADYEQKIADLTNELSSAPSAADITALKAELAKTQQELKEYQEQELYNQEEEQPAPMTAK